MDERVAYCVGIVPVQAVNTPRASLRHDSLQRENRRCVHIHYIYKKAVQLLHYKTRVHVYLFMRSYGHSSSTRTSAHATWPLMVGGNLYGFVYYQHFLVPTHVHVCVYRANAFPLHVLADAAQGTVHGSDSQQPTLNLDLFVYNTCIMWSAKMGVGTYPRHYGNGSHTRTITGRESGVVYRQRTPEFPPATSVCWWGSPVPGCTTQPLWSHTVVSSSFDYTCRKDVWLW